MSVRKLFEPKVFMYKVKAGKDEELWSLSQPRIATVQSYVEKKL